jgi:hypothetical protein
MSVQGNPYTIHDSSLVFYSDAGNIKSYVSGSTSWYDLSGNGYTGTLTNGPTFTSSFGGSIVFDGSNDCVTFGTGLTALDLTSKTIQCWIRKNGNSQKGIVDKDFDLTGGNYGGWALWTQSNGKLWWWNHGGQDVLDTGTNIIQVNTWTNVAVAYNYTAKNASFYINGTLNSSITNANIVEKASGTAQLLIGAYRNNTGLNFDGNIAAVSLYNRLLSANEILQNYDATRSRFRL